MLTVLVSHVKGLTMLSDPFFIEQHWLKRVARLPSPYWSVRAKSQIDLIVLHCISLPRGHFSNHYVDELFTGKLAVDAHPDFSDLLGVEVSAHVLVRRSGALAQFVPFDRAAWHAGVSQFQDREQCNDFSIGIELEGTDTDAFTTEQYESLVVLVRSLQLHYNIPKPHVVAHSDIAPGRKSDPGHGFDWSRFWQLLAEG